MVFVDCLRYELQFHFLAALIIDIKRWTHCMCQFGLGIKTVVLVNVTYLCHMFIIIIHFEQIKLRDLWMSEK